MLSHLQGRQHLCELGWGQGRDAHDVAADDYHQERKVRLGELGERLGTARWGGGGGLHKDVGKAERRDKTSLRLSGPLPLNALLGRTRVTYRELYIACERRH